MKHPTPAARGVTLIELMLVVALIAILSGISAGMVGNMVRRQRFRGAVREALNSIMLARNTAMSKGGHAVVSFQTNPNRILIFRDVDGDARHDVGEQIVQQVPSEDELNRGDTSRFPPTVSRNCTGGLELSSSGQRACNSTTTASYTPVIVFHSDGFCYDDLVAADMTAAGITFSDTQLGANLAISVTIGGAARIE